MDEDNGDEKYALDDLGFSSQSFAGPSEPPRVPPSYVPVSSQTSTKYSTTINVGNLQTFVVNELNYQYFYRIGNEAPEYFRAENGDYEFKYQAIGTQVSNEWMGKILEFTQNDTVYQIREYGLLNENVLRTPISPSEFILTFDTQFVSESNLDLDAESRVSFTQEVCKQYFPELSGTDSRLQFNRFATYQLNDMFIRMQDTFEKSFASQTVPIAPLQDPLGYINRVRPDWLAVNSFTIYSEDKTKKIRLMCPMFSYKSTLHTGKPRSYCVFKFLEWDEQKEEICPYMYTVELDPVKELLQTLRLSIDGVVYLMYVRLCTASYYTDPHPNPSAPIYWLPHGVTDIYHRQVDKRYLFKHDEQPDSIDFYDPVEGTRLTYDDFSNDGDCFPIAMLTCLLTLQPDMFRYINLFRRTKYKVHSDGYLAHDRNIDRGLCVDTDLEILDLFGNRMQYAYPIQPSSNVYIALDPARSTMKDIYLPDGTILDTDPFLYWSPNMVMKGDKFENRISSLSNKDLIGTFGGFPVYDYRTSKVEEQSLIAVDYGLTRAFLNQDDSIDAQKEYLYEIFDRLGCNTDLPTLFPITTPGHITTLTHIRYGDGSREYLIIEPQNGRRQEAFSYLSDETNGMVRFQLALTRTCRKNNHLKSLASPLAMYCAVDPAFYKGNLLPIYEQSLNSSYLLLHNTENASRVFLSALLQRDDLSILVQTNSRITDPSEMSSTDWLRVQLASIPLIGSVFSHPDILVDLTNGMSYMRLYHEFIDFLSFLSNPLPQVVQQLLLTATEESDNVYLAVTRSIFRCTDVSYDPSVHVSYLANLYQRMNGLYMALYQGLKHLYVDPTLFTKINLVHIQQFMTLLVTLRDSLHTLEVFSQLSSRQCTNLYQVPLSVLMSKEDSLNFFYGKPVLRGLVKYQADHPSLLPSSLPVSELVTQCIGSRPIFDYRTLYREKLADSIHMGRVLNYFRFLNDSDPNGLSVFIQRIQQVYKEVQAYTDIRIETLSQVLSYLFDQLFQTVPHEIPEPMKDDERSLFAYFIFIINLYRFDKTGTLFNRFA
jgi:hypothetical protein